MRLPWQTRTGWTKLGDGFCFPDRYEEQEHRLTNWQRGTVNDAKAACENDILCKGIHHDNDKDPDFVLLKAVGEPGGQNTGVRSCHKYARPGTPLRLPEEDSLVA